MAFSSPRVETEERSWDLILGGADRPHGWPLGVPCTSHSPCPAPPWGRQSGDPDGPACPPAAGDESLSGPSQPCGLGSRVTFLNLVCSSERRDRRPASRGRSGTWCGWCAAIRQPRRLWEAKSPLGGRPLHGASARLWHTATLPKPSQPTGLRMAPGVATGDLSLPLPLGKIRPFTLVGARLGDMHGRGWGPAPCPGLTCGPAKFTH